MAPLLCTSSASAAAPPRTTALVVRQSAPRAGEDTSAAVVIHHAIRVINTLPLAAHVALGGAGSVHVGPMACVGVLAPLPPALVRVRATLAGAAPSAEVLASAGQPGWLCCARAADGAVHSVAVHVLRDAASCTLVLHAEAWLYNLTPLALHVTLCATGANASRGDGGAQADFDDGDSMAVRVASSGAAEAPSAAADRPNSAATVHANVLSPSRQHESAPRHERRVSADAAVLASAVRLQPTPAEAAMRFPNIGAAGAALQRSESMRAVPLVATCDVPACLALAGILPDAARGAQHSVVDSSGRHVSEGAALSPLLIARPDAQRAVAMSVHVAARGDSSAYLLDEKQNALVATLRRLGTACVSLEAAEGDEAARVALRPPEGRAVAAAVVRERVPLAQRRQDADAFSRPNLPPQLPITGLAGPDGATGALLASLACTTLAVVPAWVVHNALPPLCTMTLEQPHRGMYVPAARQMVANGASAALLCTPAATPPVRGGTDVRITVAERGHMRSTVATLPEEDTRAVTLTSTAAPPQYAQLHTRAVYVPLPPLPPACQAPAPVPVLCTSLCEFDAAAAPAHVQNLTPQDARAFQQRDDAPRSRAAAAASSLPGAPAPDALHNVFQDVPAYQRRPFIFSGLARGRASGTLRLSFAIGLSLKVNTSVAEGWPVTVADWLAVRDAGVGLVPGVRFADGVSKQGSCRIVTDGAMAEDAEVRAGRACSM